MTPEDFNTLVNEFNEGCDKILGVKEKEYSDGIDRLIQFKTAAALANVSTVEACTGMMVKHTTKLYSMLDEMKKGKNHNVKAWNEVLYDQSNYLRLLKAVMVEEGAV